jgi:hypothetical protein
MKNTFNIGTTKVDIEDGFIPSGKDYVKLREIIEASNERKGAFSMQFWPMYKINARVLKVNYTKAA